MRLAPILWSWLDKNPPDAPIRAVDYHPHGGQTAVRAIVRSFRQERSGRGGSLHDRVNPRHRGVHVDELTSGSPAGVPTNCEGASERPPLRVRACSPHSPLTSVSLMKCPALTRQCNIHRVSECNVKERNSLRRVDHAECMRAGCDGRAQMLRYIGVVCSESSLASSAPSSRATGAPGSGDSKCCSLLQPGNWSAGGRASACRVSAGLRSSV